MIALLSLTFLSHACDVGAGALFGRGRDQNSVGVVQCEPQCTEGVCGVGDGCGGVCSCSGGLVCSAAGTCVSADVCNDTCQSASWYCGRLCGALCGVCGESDACYSGRCYASVSTSCEDCSLKLSVVQPEGDSASVAGRVVLAVDYAPQEVEPRPRLADLRILSSLPVSVEDVVAGEALSDAGKQLFVNPRTRKPWTERFDGTIQILAMSFDNLDRIGTGRIATVTLTADTTQPLAFSFVKREQTFAPADSDAALQATSYDALVGHIQAQVQQ